jgi:hypothetical protein
MVTDELGITHQLKQQLIMKEEEETGEISGEIANYRNYRSQNVTYFRGHQKGVH